MCERAPVANEEKGCGLGTSGLYMMTMSPTKVMEAVHKEGMALPEPAEYSAILMNFQETEIVVLSN